MATPLSFIGSNTFIILSLFVTDKKLSKNIIIFFILVLMTIATTGKKIKKHILLEEETYSQNKYQ